MGTFEIFTNILDKAIRIPPHIFKSLMTNLKLKRLLKYLNKNMKLKDYTMRVADLIRDLQKHLVKTKSTMFH